jgi:hypothetical protein
LRHLEPRDPDSPPAPSTIRPRSVWWFVAGCLVVVSAYLFFRSATASYNSVSPPGGYSVQQVACLSVYGWLRDEPTDLPSTLPSRLSPDERAAYFACHAAIGDRETTVEVLLGVAVVFLIVGYQAGRGATARTAARHAA